MARIPAAALENQWLFPAHGEETTVTSTHRLPYPVPRFEAALVHVHLQVPGRFTTSSYLHPVHTEKEPAAPSG